MSGDVRILLKTVSSGTELPTEVRPENSERQSRKFIVNQKSVMTKKMRRERMADHCEGILSDWPTRRRRASTLGLAAIIALNFTPYLAAMDVMVSPDLTACDLGRCVVDGEERVSTWAARG